MNAEENFVSGSNQGTNIVFNTTIPGGGGVRSEKMRITGAGNVGIGTTTPGGLLTIAAGTGGSGNNSGGQAPGANIASAFEWGLQATGDGVTNLRTAVRFETSVGTGGSDSKIGFYTNKYGTSRAERMTIDPSGNVGIGTASPQDGLHVLTNSGTNLSALNTGVHAGVTTIASQDYAYLSLVGKAAAGGSFIDFHDAQSDGDPDFRLKGIGTALQLFSSNNSGTLSATPMVSFAGSGNVGIGTTSPAHTLHAVTDDAITNGLTTVASFAHSTSGTPAAGIGSGISFRAERSDGAVAQAAYIGGVLTNVTAGAEDGDLVIGTQVDSSGMTERMRVTSNGNVGIGTTSPAAKLEIMDNAAFGAPTNAYLGFSQGSFDSGTVSGSRIVAYFDNSLNTHKNSGAIDFAVENGSATSSASMRFSQLTANTLTERMRISTDGNVGIGLVNPSYKLDVLGDVNASGCVRAGGSTLGGTCSSDERLKSEIQPFDLGLKALLGISPKTFKYNGLGEHPISTETEIGVIAQEVETTAPEIIVSRNVKLHPEDDQQTEIKQVNYSAFTYIVINAVKELYHQWSRDSEAIHRELASVKAENAQLKARLEAIEKNLKTK